mmetsp:Transcript_13611/g.50704  ORF Transcript_13611/g.50704 Transcript_13611/m.50704 type:complete len:207 (-) Transcript_13611:506-1126(-)
MAMKSSSGSGGASSPRSTRSCCFASSTFSWTMILPYSSKLRLAFAASARAPVSSWAASSSSAGGTSSAIACMRTMTLWMWLHSAYCFSALFSARLSRRYRICIESQAHSVGSSGSAMREPYPFLVRSSFTSSSFFSSAMPSRLSAAKAEKSGVSSWASRRSVVRLATWSSCSLTSITEGTRASFSFASASLVCAEAHTSKSPTWLP